MAGEDWNLNIRHLEANFGLAGPWLFPLISFYFYLFIYWRAVDRGRGCSLCINT
jgi:hypothetical protein